MLLQITQKTVPGLGDGQKIQKTCKQQTQHPFFFRTQEVVLNLLDVVPSAVRVGVFSGNDQLCTSLNDSPFMTYLATYLTFKGRKLCEIFLENRMDFSESCFEDLSSLQQRLC